MRTQSSRRSHGGFMILEVLLALLIFSLGVLGLVGLQARTVAQSGQSQYRATATVLANELIGDMWVGNRTSAALQTTYGANSTDAGYLAWKAKVSAALPQASTYPPVITMVQKDPLTLVIPSPAPDPLPATPTPSTEVTIQMRWKLPTEDANDQVHNIVVVTRIK